MGRQSNDPGETQHFKPPTIDEALETINQVLSPIYSQVLLDRIAKLEAENEQLHQENERLRSPIKDFIKSALREIGLKD